MADMVTILKTAVQRGSSDIHICVNKPPMMRLNGEIETEGTRITSVRGQIGARLQTLQSLDSSLKNQNLQTQQSLSNAKDADLAQVLSELVAQQTAFEATLRTAAQSMQLSLVHFL